MANYLAPNLATEIAPQVDPRRAKQRVQETRRLEAVVKDDDMWKELQQELAKAKVVSHAAVQEVTRRFLERREAEIDSQIKLQSMASASKRTGSTRRVSNLTEYSTRSSLAFFSSTSQSMRRGLSMGFSAAEVETASKGSNKPQNFNELMNCSISAMQASMNRLSLETSSSSFLPVRDWKCATGSRGRGCDDIFEVMDHAYSLSHSIPDHVETSVSSGSEILSMDASTSTHSGSPVIFDLQGKEECESDDELIVCFPSQPRRQSQGSEIHYHQSAARTA